MDGSRLLSILKRELSERKGEELIAFQNHLYGCFIVMEDITQGILEVVDEDYIIGNSLYLNTKTQFGQIGIRYYGFTMDGKAILNGDIVRGDYYEAWMVIFRETAISRDMEAVDRIEDEVIQMMSGFRKDENYFMNALEHEGNLSPDWVEKAIYAFHPDLQRLSESEKRERDLQKEKIEETHKSNKDREKKDREIKDRETKDREIKEKRRTRGLRLTRRQVRQANHTRLSTTRRQVSSLGAKK